MGLSIFSLLAGYRSRIFLWDVCTPGTSPKSILKTASCTGSSDASLKGIGACILQLGIISSILVPDDNLLIAGYAFDRSSLGTFEGDIAIFDPRYNASPHSEVPNIFSYSYENMSALYHVLPEDTDGATGVIQVISTQ